MSDVVVNMTTLEVDRKDKSEDEVKEEIIDRVLSGELDYINSIREISSTPWGSPKSYYTGGKFSHVFAMVDVSEFLSLHDAVGHTSSHAYQGTVDRVGESIENGKEGEIPTIPLVLEPDNYGENPMTYDLVHEGRSRAVGAREAGLKEIPVILAVRRPRR